MRQAPHHGSLSTLSDMAEVVGYTGNPGGARGWRAAGCEEGRTSVEVDVPDASPDAKIQANVPSYSE